MPTPMAALRFILVVESTPIRMAHDFVRSVAKSGALDALRRCGFVCLAPSASTIRGRLAVSRDLPLVPP